MARETRSERAAACLRSSASIFSTPVVSSASTSTNRPATSGSTAQEMPFTVSVGPSRLIASTTITVAKPATKVGRPSWMSSADDAMSAMPVATIPRAATLPLFESVGGSTSVSMLSMRRER